MARRSSRTLFQPDQGNVCQADLVGGLVVAVLRFCIKQPVPVQMAHLVDVLGHFELP